MAEGPRRAGAFSDPHLLKRIGSALVMGLAALAAAWWGGWPFGLLWSIASVGVYAEWLKLTRHAGEGYPLFWPYALPLVAFVLWLSGVGSFTIVAGLLGLCGLLLYVWAPQQGVARLWAYAGLLYALPVALGPLVLRHDAALGFAAILYLFALVWGTDVGAYFCGRGVGGPKLWPRISPKKTWAGFLGGTLIGTVLALGVVSAFGVAVRWPLVLMSYGLAVASQGGDLLESALKRHFGVKDSSGLIPGHGGLMDRLDGFIVAGGLAALVGVLRSGSVGAAATGLLLW